jgi:hypothetical protein
MASVRRTARSDPAQQQGLRAEGLAEQVLRDGDRDATQRLVWICLAETTTLPALLPAIDLEGPAPVREASDSGRVLDDAVE